MLKPPGPFSPGSWETNSMNDITVGVNDGHWASINHSLSIAYIEKAPKKSKRKKGILP